MDFVRDNALREASLDHENGLLAGIVSVDFDAGSMKGQPPCFTPGLPCNDSKLWSHHRSIQISHCGRSRYQGIMLQFWERKWNKHAFCVVLWVGGWLLLRYCTILIHITIALFCYICCGDEAVQDVLSQRSARDGSTKTSGRFWCQSDGVVLPNGCDRICSRPLGSVESMIDVMTYQRPPGLV